MIYVLLSSANIISFAGTFDGPETNVPDAEFKYTVVIKFVVSKDGSLSDIACENDPGFGMCGEAIRVIEKTKNWTPAIQNGRNVNAYRSQPVTFIVEEK